MNFELKRRAVTAGIVMGVMLSSPVRADYQIGFMTDLSGALSDAYTPIWEGFDLYVKALNAKGGIDGEKIILHTEDDGLNLQKAISLTKKLALQQKVIGIFGLSVSSIHGPVFEELRRLKVPAVTAFSATSDSLAPAKPFSFSTGSLFQIAGEAIGELTPKLGVKGKVVGMTIDTVGGRAALRHNKLAVERVGYGWDEVAFPIQSVDFTPFAQAAVAKNPAIVVGHYGTAQNLGIIPALRRSGFAGPYLIANYGVTETAIEGAAKAAGSGENIYVVSRYAPPQENIPAVEQIRAAAKAHNLKRSLTQVHVEGWVLGMVMHAAVTKCGKGCTAEKLNEALENLNVNTGGLTGGPIVFTKDNHYGPSFWRLYKWNNASRKLDPVSEWVRRDGIEFGSP